MNDVVQKTANPFPLRLPPELMKWVKDCAAQGDRSINRQLIRLIRQAKQNDTPMTDKTLN